MEETRKVEPQIPGNKKNDTGKNPEVEKKLSLLDEMRVFFSAFTKKGFTELKKVAKNVYKESIDEISTFLSENKKAIFLQLGFALVLAFGLMALDLGTIKSLSIGFAAIVIYWAILLKKVLTNKVFGSISTAEIVLYTTSAVFALYNPFNFDLLHLGKYIYELGGLGVNRYTVLVLLPFVAILYFWYYTARYTFETSYESLGGWKAAGVVFMYVAALIFVVAVIGLDNISFYMKPFIFGAQLLLAYIIYDSFGFAKRHYARSKTLTTNSHANDEIGSSDAGNPDDELALNEAVEEENLN
ncbi:MAG: hypothetical protein KAH72_09715 [Flavobacteriaceae bacterium]|nr:hypothetical protein [Flavobacteriaceae bacterium]